MIEQLKKLIENLTVDEEALPDTVYSTIGIILTDKEEVIEFEVDSALKVDLKGDWLFVEATQYIGVININHIVHISEI